MVIYGAIKNIGEKEQISETFSKVEVTLDTSTYEQGTGKKYENAAKVQFTNDNIQKLADFKPGDRVKVSFSIYGKEGISKDGKPYFIQNLNAFKIEKI
nr:MAG TPA: protein of unknown function (DUF3127) [Caudoviricetes sp.]